MPLTATAAGVVCVVAALVMLVLARGTWSRAAHAVVVVVMVALLVGSHDARLSWAGAAVLAATAGALLLRRRDAEARRCAPDVAVCAGLVALMGAAAALPALVAPAPSAHSHGHGEAMAGMHAAGTTSPLATALVVALSLGLVATWAVVTRRSGRDARAHRAGAAAGWSMVLAMAVMVAS